MNIESKPNPRILSINLGNFGSTGGIMKGISSTAKVSEYDTRMAYPGSCHNSPRQSGDYLIMSEFWKKVNEKLTYYTGFNGCFAVPATLRLLHHMKKIQPDILHFHNLHNSYVNLPLLFGYVKRKNISVVWTLHDCWPFTGQCPHFTMAGCGKWKTGCHDCSTFHQYPASRMDRTKIMWALKKKWFTGVEHMTLITPSQWLADLVKQSFLKDYPVQVIHNGIDLSVFRPTDSHFRETHQISDSQFVLLGVAFDWGKRKGLDVFLELARRLPESYKIVLVGTNREIDCLLPERVLSIHRTNDQKELAQLYSAADVFVNPTREDNFPTTNIEALACGTPVVTFRTGGSPEIPDEQCGSVVDCDDVDALEKEIVRICETHPYSRNACLRRAADFSKEARFQEYVQLFDTYVGKA